MQHRFLANGHVQFGYGQCLLIMAVGQKENAWDVFQGRCPWLCCDRPLAMDSSTIIVRLETLGIEGRRRVGRARIGISSALNACLPWGE